MIMAQNEETLYFDNTHPEVRQESKDKTQNAADKATWKKVDRKSTRLNSSHYQQSRMPSSA